MRFFYRSPSAPARLIVGLGNPGARYARTRHNLGFRIIEALARAHGPVTWRSKRDARVGVVADLGTLVMPQTFMNDSGRAVAPLVRYYRVPLAGVLVVCDDFNLDFGQLRMRRWGSDGGHNGLKSVIEALASEDFPRLRVGVGRDRVDDIDFVLSVFSPEQERELPAIIDRAVAGVETFVRDGIDAAIAHINAFGGSV